MPFLILAFTFACQRFDDSAIWDELREHEEEIQKLERIQKQYLFLDRYDIHTMTDLAGVIGNLQEKDAQAVSEKRKVYREKQRFLPLFEIAKQMEMLENAHAAYTNGDSFFEKEEKHPHHRT